MINTWKLVVLLCHEGLCASCIEKGCVRYSLKNSSYEVLCPTIVFDTVEKHDFAAPDKNVNAMPSQRKTFAQALGTTCDIPLSELPIPCIKGDMIVVWIDEVNYLAGLEDCKTHIKSCSRCGRL
ncbi:hypothetical protein VNO80_29937 [Phaseolus coccineus]|uniref:Uncharacterized protein n=1 Tax=Phaseolus coccineus TaxID=3886 RepID=A0AAN9LEX8_PHACN